ncbi:MAG: radical SAM protein [Bacteroidales bacterium]|nr:radical SAM protein [Bacteroidales bacterium]
MVKILKYTPRYYEPFDGSVHYLCLNASDTCNYRCMKCMQSESIKIRPTIEPINVCDLLTRAKKELGIKTIYLSGSGETFLVGNGNTQIKLENYKKLIRQAYELDIAIVQFTNGYYLTEEMVEYLSDFDVSLVVSIDTLNPEKYSRLTNTGIEVFDKVMDNIKYARKKLPVVNSGEKRLYRLGVNMAISNVCEEDIDSVKSFCGDDIIFFSNYPLIKGSFKENIEYMCAGEDELEKFKQLCSKTSTYQGLAGVTTDGVCGFLKYGLTIDFDGKVLICPYDTNTGLLFGNISDYESMHDAFKIVQDKLTNFAEGKQNAMYCPLRHAEYDSFFDNDISNVLRTFAISTSQC